ncbi:hypothetical protein [Paenibacillus sp. 2TAB19]|uniref:hypothetical protein n=1 Tax=Paenibacillus sp. 2TAB19 TaxID=3233003 RepID=UPI003F955E56
MDEWRLSDTARKTLTFLWNEKRYDPFMVNHEALQYISVRTQRSKSKIKIAVNELVCKGYLQWTKADRLFKILYCNEDDKPKPWTWGKN